MTATAPMLSRLFTFMFLINSVPVFSQNSMFRGGADHKAAVSMKGNSVFGEEAWKYNANAPIRSSVAFSANAIFFGTSSGELVALDQKTGAVKWRYKSGH